MLRRRKNLQDTCARCLMKVERRHVFLFGIFLVSVFFLHPTLADRVLSVAERYSVVIRSLIKVVL